ncbi:MAG: gamma-glutamyl-gamma-aminobutyrate hydrolase [Rhodospirillaceae bacterium]|nr:gamma-glutamyl-gamma-aminobutyrate hydrolase [Rhodospirillaceae bacterium]|tara:strand:+ start:6452 stop:7177 length:726 start_codon:yes stop_codon:yes gene_type:complete
MKNNSLPLIGLTLDQESSGSYSRYKWYAIRKNYCSAVTNAGGLPIGIPHEVEQANDYLNIVDGLIITGGAFDVDPRIFGETDVHKSVVIKENRTNFEIEITKRSYDLGIPVMGICGGQQLMNVALGGTLIQHIPDREQDSLEHEQTNPRHETSHSVQINSSSKLGSIIGKKKIQVNSAHHQAVDKVPPCLNINALAPDGIIEGIEDPSHPWFIGIQWHPEFEITKSDKRIFSSFIKASRNE